MLEHRHHLTKFPVKSSFNLENQMTQSVLKLVSIQYVEVTVETCIQWAVWSPS